MKIVQKKNRDLKKRMGLRGSHWMGGLLWAPVIGRLSYYSKSQSCCSSELQHEYSAWRL